jgi:hypothetical protein
VVEWRSGFEPRLLSYSDYIALRRIEDYPEAKRIFEALRREAGDRSFRVLAGLALFIYYRRMGYSISESMRIAVRESKASEKSIRSAAAKLRRVVEGFLRET